MPELDYIHSDYGKAFVEGARTNQVGVFISETFVGINDGNLHDAILFAQIMYWHMPSLETGKTRLRVKNDGEYWVAKNHKDWLPECFIKERSVRNIIPRLLGRKLIYYKLSGFAGSKMPYIRVNWSGLEAAIKAWNGKSASQFDLKGQAIRPQRAGNSTSKGKPNTKTTTENKRIKDSSASEVGQPLSDKNTITPAIKGKVTRLLNQYKKNTGIKKLTTSLWEEAIEKQDEKVCQLARMDDDEYEYEILILEELENRNPDNIAPAKVATTDEIFEAVVKLWGNPAASGRAWNIRHLLTGTSKTGQWAKCKLQTPATRDELYAYKKWRNAQGRGNMNMPEKPDQIQKSFEEFRAHPQYSHFMQNTKLEDATPEERSEVDDGVKRASGSVQPNLHEKTMPKSLRINWYKQNNIEYDPDTGIRVGADSEGYV